MNGSDDTGFCRPFACFHDSVTIDILSRLVGPFFMDFLVGCDREVFFKKDENNSDLLSRKVLLLIEIY